MGKIAVFFRGMKRNRDLTLKLEQLQKEAEANPGNPLSNQTGRYLAQAQSDQRSNGYL